MMHELAILLGFIEEQLRAQQLADEQAMRGRTDEKSGVFPTPAPLLGNVEPPVLWPGVRSTLDKLRTLLS